MNTLYLCLVGLIHVGLSWVPSAAHESSNKTSLQCNNCFVSTCKEKVDKEFAPVCYYATEFFKFLSPTLLASQECPNGAVPWSLKNVSELSPNMSQTCGAEESHCGRRTIVVTSLIHKTEPAVNSTNVTTPTFPILRPQPEPVEQTFTYSVYSCTFPDRDCKVDFSSKTFNKTVNGTDMDPHTSGTSMVIEYRAEMIATGVGKKVARKKSECAMCNTTLCNKGLILQSGKPSTGANISGRGWVDCAAVLYFVHLVAFAMGSSVLS